MELDKIGSFGNFDFSVTYLGDTLGAFAGVRRRREHTRPSSVPDPSL